MRGLGDERQGSATQLTAETSVHPEVLLCLFDFKNFGYPQNSQTEEFGDRHETWSTSSLGCIYVQV